MNTLEKVDTLEIHVGYDPIGMQLQITDQYNNILESVHVPYHATRLYSIKELMGFKKYYQMKYDIVSILEDVKNEYKINNKIDNDKLNYVNEIIQNSIFENKIKLVMRDCVNSMKNNDTIMTMNNMYDVKFYINESRLLMEDEGLRMVAIWI